MKILLLLTALLGCATLGHAQTTPATGSSTAVSGTKNVGSDRADVPKAPGMQASGTTPISSGRLHSTKARHQRGARRNATNQQAAPKQ